MMVLAVESHMKRPMKDLALVVIVVIATVLVVK
jgi:hypothetical protein